MDNSNDFLKNNNETFGLDSPSVFNHKTSVRNAAEVLRSFNIDSFDTFGNASNITDAKKNDLIDDVTTINKTLTENLLDSEVFAGPIADSVLTSCL